MTTDRRIPAFADSGFEPVSSVLHTFVDKSGKSLCYQLSYSIEVFHTYQQGNLMRAQTRAQGTYNFEGLICPGSFKALFRTDTVESVFFTDTV